MLSCDFESRHTFTSRYEVVLIVVHNRGEAQVGDRAGMSMAGQRDSFWNSF